MRRLRSGRRPGGGRSPVCQLVATVPTGDSATAGGPDVLPLTSRLPGLTGGPLLVAVRGNQGSGKIFAVSPPPSGAVTEVTTVPSAESVAVIPRTTCSYAPWTASPGSSAVYFAVADGQSAISFLPLSALAGRAAGNALVTTGAGNGVALLGSVKGKIATSPFATSSSGLHGSAFVDCTPPMLLQTFRSDSALTPRAGGLVSVWILPTATFNPLTICVGHGVTAGGDECPLIADPAQTPPTYGVTGTEASFDECGSSLVPTARGPALECKFYKNRLGIQTPKTTGRTASPAFTAAAGFVGCTFSLAPGCELFRNLLGAPATGYTGRLIIKAFYVGGPTGGTGGVGSGATIGARPGPPPGGTPVSPNNPGSHGNGQGSGGGQGSGEQGNKGVGHENGKKGGGDGDAEGDD